MPAKQTETSKPTTARTRKPKALPGREGGGVGKGGIVRQHGVTTTGYQRGCRCKLCVQAASEYARAARERKAAAAKTNKPAKVTATKAKPKAMTAKRRAAAPKRTNRKVAAAK
jgi:hypothetical protein